jgi:hypothetical protein
MWRRAPTDWRGDEGAFNICTFRSVEALTLASQAELERLEDPNRTPDVMLVVTG